MSRRKSIALTRQLDQLLAGVLPVDDSSAEALALLPVAAGIGLDESIHLQASSLITGRSELLADIGQLPEQQPVWSAPAWLRTPALAGGLAAILSGGAIAYAAQGATPDSPLYPVQQAVQAVSQSFPILPQPTATAVPSPTATMVPVPEATPVEGSTPNRSRDRQPNAIAAKPTAQPTSVRRDADREANNDNRRQDDDSRQPTATVIVTTNRSNREQSDGRSFAGPNESRGLKGDVRTPGDSSNANRTSDDQSGRTGDRSARFDRGG